MMQFLVGLAKDKLASFLSDGASLLKDVNQEVEDIKQESTSIQSFLKDADKRAESVDGDNEGVRAWVQELREGAFEIEDVVTEYTHLARKQQSQDEEQQSQQRGISEFVRRKAVAPILSLKWRHGIASQIHDIKARLVGIYQRGERFGFRSSVQQELSCVPTSSYAVRRTFPDSLDNEIVGIESDRDDLMGRLVHGSPQFTVIVVVGEGGSGKTTLARLVYDRIGRQFACYAWVVVPEPYNRDQLLRTVMRELFKSSGAIVPDDIGIMDEQTLIQNLRSFLQHKRFLIVFDDIWKEDFWRDVELAFTVSSSNIGGRVMITTRKMKVAEFCRRSCSVHVHTHRMKPLPQNEAWKLFCKKVFKPKGHCPSELENLSAKIVERCGYLPLAVLAVAGLLFTREKTVEEWEAFNDRLSFELESDADLKNVLKILSLSFDELPYDLKRCFLYFGMFPSYYEIRSTSLIRKWMAEGFVKEQEGRTLEEVSQEYMNELVNRCLVEPTEYHSVTKRVKVCRIHDLFHAIVTRKSKDTSFSQVFRGCIESRLQGIPRRMSIINASNNLLEGIKARNTHSVVVFSEDDKLNTWLPALATNLKFLKVLDFENAQHLDHFPEDIGNLFDLRYLSVRGTNLKILPKSIKKLEYLETLDLRQSMVNELPADTISKLHKLRTLHAGNKFGGVRGIKINGGIENLKALQTLCRVEAGGNGVNLLRELRNVTQLKKLGITKLRNEDWGDLCDCVKNFKLLKSLCIIVADQHEIIDRDAISSPPQFLRSIKLGMTLRKLPEWMAQLQNLVRLRLFSSKLEDSDSLRVLQNSPSLLELWLCLDAYVGEDLQFGVGVFPKLEKLLLRNLSSSAGCE